MANIKEELLTQMDMPEGSFGVAQVLQGLECARVGEPRVADSLKMSLDTAATCGHDTQAGQLKHAGIRYI